MHAGADLDELIAALVTPAAGQEPVRRPRIRARDLQLYIHLAAEDLEGGIATVEGLGAVTVARIEDWLARHTAAGGRVRVTPVVDPARADAVDRHDPPAWMAEQVRLTDQLCVFPYCQTHARDCDLDHIVPYDDTGPPGQTEPTEPRPVVQAASPGEDREAMALRTQPRRVACLDLAPGRPLPRQRRRHPRPHRPLSPARPRGA